MTFLQEAPSINNTFESDSNLGAHLEKVFSKNHYPEIKAHLKNVGALAAGEWLDFSRDAERNLPTHVAFDAWGKRIDEIKMAPGWRLLENAAAREGIVACAYERKFGEWSRVYQAALLYLFHPSSAFVSCPLAMTDGAARAIELFGDEELKSGAFKKLTSRDPSMFWTSGQWMTERAGGSDVSDTSTIAHKSSNSKWGWNLNGEKWFTSATTSQMAMLLARPSGAEARSRGLSLFYTELRDSQNALQGIEILRLKDKLGTKALPTAELLLKNTPAKLVGGEGGGVKKISALFNITRVYNSICAIGQWRRALDLAWSYSKLRSAFGKKLIDHPLHLQTLKELENDFKKSFDLVFFVAHLLGKDECNTATEADRALLRALTPIAKLSTAKKSVAAISEVVESFGGAGYIEDVGIAKHLRDAQVFSIWEGTTNVLALDFLRSIEKENTAPALLSFIQERCSKDATSKLLLEMLQRGLKEGRAYFEPNARKISLLVAEVVAGGLA